ncbi:MAG: helix-turn-helix domain-containing protein, partial [Myxococcota bacterium]
RALMNSSGEAIPAEAISLGETRSKRAVSRTQFRHEEDHELLTLLREHRWNITAVAKELGVHRATVHRKLKRLGVERPDAK